MWAWHGVRVAGRRGNDTIQQYNAAAVAGRPAAARRRCHAHRPVLLGVFAGSLGAVGRSQGLRPALHRPRRPLLATSQLTAGQETRDAPHARGPGTRDAPHARGQGTRGAPHARRPADAPTLASPEARSAEIWRWGAAGRTDRARQARPHHGRLPSARGRRPAPAPRGRRGAPPGALTRHGDVSGEGLRFPEREGGCSWFFAARSAEIWRSKMKGDRRCLFCEVNSKHEGKLEAASSASRLRSFGSSPRNAHLPVSRGG